MRNTLKQAVVLWGMVLLLVLWSVFISPSGVLRWAGAAAIVLAVAALLIYRRRQAWTEMTGDAGLSSLPPETYRQPVVLVCGDMSAHLFTDSPVRQVSEGLYLHVPDEEQLVAQVERLLTLRPAWASQLAVAYTVMPGMYRDAAVLTGRLRRFAHSMATVRRRAGVNVPLASLERVVRLAVAGEGTFTVAYLYRRRNSGSDVCRDRLPCAVAHADQHTGAQPATLLPAESRKPDAVAES